MVRKRWTAKMVGDETRASDRCLHLVVCMRDTYAFAAHRRDIRRARPTGCVCFMPRATSGEVGFLSLRPARVFLSPSHDL